MKNKKSPDRLLAQLRKDAKLTQPHLLQNLTHYIKKYKVYLKKAGAETKLIQDEDYVDFTVSVYCKYEKGKCRPPRERALLFICYFKEKKLLLTSEKANQLLQELSQPALDVNEIRIIFGDEVTSGEIPQPANTAPVVREEESTAKVHFTLTTEQGNKEFGKLLKQLRAEKAQLSIRKLLDELFDLITGLEKLITTLEKLGADIRLNDEGDLPYTVADILKYENGEVKVSRNRVLLFIFFFRQKGVISLEEANQLLYHPGYENLNEHERKIIFEDKTTASTSSQKEKIPIQSERWNHFSDAFKVFLESSRYTYTEIAYESGVTREALSNWGKGRAHRPQWEDIIRVAAALRLSIHETNILLSLAHRPSFNECQKLLNDPKANIRDNDKVKEAINKIYSTK